MLGQTSITRAETEERIRAMLSDTTEAYYTPAEVLYWLRSALARLARDLPSRYLPGLQQSAGLSTTEGQNSLDLSGVSPEIFRIHQVLVALPAANGYPSVPTPALQMTHADQAGIGTDARMASDARPPRWFLWDERISLYAYGNSTTAFPATGIVIQYIQEPPWPIDASATLPLSDDAIEMAVYLAAKQGFLKANSVGQAAAMEQGYRDAVTAAGLTIREEGQGE